MVGENSDHGRPALHARLPLCGPLPLIPRLEGDEAQPLQPHNAKEETSMRIPGLPAVLACLLVPCASAHTVSVDALSPQGEEFSRGFYQCDDGTPNFAWYSDMAGEGLANQFTVMGAGIARIDTIFLTVDGSGSPGQSVLLGVWNDAGGSPGEALYLAPLDLTPYVPDPGPFVWAAIPLASQNIVVEGDFWIGYFDDLSLSYRPHLDDSGGCNTWFYDPILEQWIDIDDHPLGLPPGLSLLFRGWASEDVGIDLVSFEASPHDGGILLEWSTATETNTFGYFIMRSSSEQSAGDVISEVIPGAGTTSTPQRYRFKDTDVEPGVRYFYRLIDVDTAGIETPHGPISIRLVPDDGGSWGKVKAQFE